MKNEQTIFEIIIDNIHCRYLIHSYVNEELAFRNRLPSTGSHASEQLDHIRRSKASSIKIQNPIRKTLRIFIRTLIQRMQNFTNSAISRFTLNNVTSLMKIASQLSHFFNLFNANQRGL